MVIGLLGPSVPGIVEDLGITYSQAGLFFTLLSIGSLLGTTAGAMASDYVNRKLIYAVFAGFLASGLLIMGFVPSYILICIVIFCFSLFGSPIGAIGQSIMLDTYPEKRARYLSIQTFFAAFGSFVAPLLVSLNYALQWSWRASFMETAGLVTILFLAILFIRIPNSQCDNAEKRPIKEIIKNPNIIFAAILIFLSVALDLGFSYWLAEYFKTELQVSLKLSSAIVSIYLVGVIVGRLSTSWLLKLFKTNHVIFYGLATAFISILVFLLVPIVNVKVVFALIYGLGVGPLFPLVMAKGTEVYPKQSGAVTGVLFACLSLGGTVFPLLLGVLATHFTIGRSYFFIVFVVIVIALLLVGWTRYRAKPT
jgi:MFS family permease